MLQIALLIFLSVFPVFSSAEDLDLDKVPPLHRVVIFQSTRDSEHYLILGKSERFGDSGNWYVLDSSNGKLTAPKLMPNSLVWFRGGFDLKFESGLRLFVANGDNSVNAQGALIEPIPTGLIDPRSGMEPLREVRVQKDLLDSLNVTQRIAPDFLQRVVGQTENTKSSLPRAPRTEEIVLLSVAYSDAGVLDRDLPSDLKSKLRRGKVDAINVMDFMREDGRTELLVWVFEEQAKGVKEWIEGELKTSVTASRHILQNAPASPGPELDSEAFSKSETLELLGRIAAKFDQLEKRFPVLSPQESEHLAVLLAWSLSAIESALNWNAQTAGILSRWQDSRAASARFSGSFEIPLYDLMARGYELLHRIGTPLSRDILLFNGRGTFFTGRRVQFLNREAGPNLGSYFQHWLTILKEKIEWVRGASPAERNNMQMVNGGHPQEFEFYNFEFRDYYSKEQTPPYLDYAPVNLTFRALLTRVFSIFRAPFLVAV